jgi:RNA polymerase sigma-70 factor (ECF subfamily)
MPDSSAFAEQLYARHGRPLMRLAVHLTRNWHQAEDLAQETMVRAWRHRDIIGSGQEQAWLAATARNLAIDRYRREQVRHAHETRYAVLATPWDDPAGQIADTVTVRAAVAALPPGHRAVIAELYYAGRTITETTAVLGIPPGTVKSRASHALAALRSALTARPPDPTYPRPAASPRRAARRLAVRPPSKTR